MKQPFSLRSVAAVALLLFGVAVTARQNPLTFDWKAFGAATTKGRAPIAREDERARYVVAQVANQLMKMKVPVNNNWGGRATSKAKYGQQDIGTCTWIRDSVEKALLGAGFRSDQLFGVIGVGSDRAVIPLSERILGEKASLWLNINHIAPAIVINGKVLVFDLWHHAYDTGGYAGMAGSKWNGRRLADWCVKIKHYPGFEYVTCGSQVSTVLPMSPNTLENDIVAKQFALRFPNIKGKKPVKPNPPVTKPHWEYIDTNVPKIREEQLRDPRRYDRGTASGGPGKLVVTSVWNDMNLKEHTCSATLTWSVTGNSKSLVPGTKLTIKGGLTTSGEIANSQAGIEWTVPGLEAHVSYGGAIGVKQINHSGSGTTPLDAVATIPEKSAFPGGQMVLRFVAYARGYGGLEYRYKWVEK